jgi:hypothetical protein
MYIYMCVLYIYILIQLNNEFNMTNDRGYIAPELSEENEYFNFLFYYI